MKKNKEIKEKLVDELHKYSHPPGEMFPIIHNRFIKDGGYVLIGWNTMIKILDDKLEIEYTSEDLLRILNEN